MIHNRDDYNQIQDPSGKIGEEEPVFLLRGTDKFTPDLVRHWAILYMRSHPEVTKEVDAVYHSVLAWANKIEMWQKQYGCKIPDVPVGELVTRVRNLKDLKRNS